MNRRYFLTLLAILALTPIWGANGSPIIDGSGLGELDSETFQRLVDTAPPETTFQMFTVRVEGGPVVLPSGMALDRCDFNVRSLDYPAVWAPESGVTVSNCHVFAA